MFNLSVISTTEFLNSHERKAQYPTHRPAEFGVTLTTHIMAKDTPKITAYRDDRIKITGTSKTHSGYSVYAVWYISKVKKKIVEL